MLKSWAVRTVIVTVGVVALLAILRFQSRNQRQSSHSRAQQASETAAPQQPREEVTVGFLPVT